MGNQPTEASFLKAVAKHTMTVLMDQGSAYRHVRFSQAGSSNMYFDLITVPGKLIYTGDMGTFVFQRLHDMFEFFRTDRKDKTALYINKGYWAEKLIATDSNGASSKGAEELSADSIRRVVWDDFKHFVRSNSHKTTKEERRDLWEEIKSDVLGFLEDGEESTAIKAAMSFRYNFKRGIASPSLRFEFYDFLDHNFNDYTYHFVWACYAIAWGIQQWDMANFPVRAVQP